MAKLSCISIVLGSFLYIVVASHFFTMTGKGNRNVFRKWCQLKEINKQNTHHFSISVFLIHAFNFAFLPKKFLTFKGPKNEMATGKIMYTEDKQ